MAAWPVSAVYQPIVDLRDGAVVAVEALARGGPGAPAASPAVLFAEARAAGGNALRTLDSQCLRAALTGLAGLTEPATVFVNLEPSTIASMRAGEFRGLADLIPAGVRIVLEVTERALLEDPAELLAGVARARDAGWSVAVDDVGAEPAALALLPFLAPDVIKLDLALVRAHASMEIAAIVNAVRGEAERSGALILAEGIESDGHLERALSLGAQLGQGWRFGRPDGRVELGSSPLRLGRSRRLMPAVTPFEVLSREMPAQRIAAPLLAAMSQQIEQQALLLDELAVVVAGFQDARLFSGPLQMRFQALAASTALTAVFAPGMPAEPAVGVRGSTTAPGDPLADEWVLAVVSPPYAAAIAARESREPSADGHRRLDYVLTYERDRVLAAAACLLARMRPAPAGPVGNPAGEVVAPRSTGAPAGRTARLRPAGALPPEELPELLLRAVSTASNGITIADARAPDTPLVYANRAFLELTGYPEEEVLGRNCRFLQGSGTDRIQAHYIARQLAAGREVQTVLLNYRRDGIPFWNEITISPVHDGSGRLTHFIGNQVDVTERVHQQERAAYLAFHDPLTGLLNRPEFFHRTERELRLAREGESGVAVLFLDLDGFDTVNEGFGHRVGDEVLASVAARLEAAAGEGVVLVRMGGDEFAAVLAGVPPEGGEEVERLARRLSAVVREPLRRGGRELRMSASVGAAVFPRDGRTAEELLDAAVAAMGRVRRSEVRRRSC
ncbi:PAS domain S-box-containing protein/diguanylate cyclase (GGDEF)-like protein [Kineococcus xinjiangensis]|uniref:PAS domain S-box-containing protein/diguanylate cyclase (GGDEF)-like protein n=1 Tax=Kineococcus xinjiangensis TaxID=512762 RepID=A0A2S6IDP8_9ACTN|nr:diguanylate cyclase [Kineococcus xinjiangensis]PPK92329.1 PAS domain S-box-containing protein/diguanylate cyclase (GGDEF)-like protein [Kineococcus xinjiangensis]